MSNTTKRPYAQVLPIAQKLIARFAPLCDHIELAGSLRRECDMIGDIEICCIPSSVVQYDLFNEPVAEIYALYEELDSLLDNGAIRHVTPRKHWGDINRRFTFEASRGNVYSVDLYMWTADSWIFNFLVKTGPADFSKSLVTERRKSGRLPNGWTIKNGFQIYDEYGEHKPVECEQDVFDLYGLNYLAPKDR